MEQNYYSGASSHSSVNVRGFSFLKSKIKLLFALFFISLGFNNNLYSQIAQRGSFTSATSTNATITINRPVGVVVGDIMLVNISSRDTGGNNLSNPTSAGWTLV